MRPSQITHVSNDVGINGTGITNVLLDLAISQARAGRPVTVLCARCDPEARELLESAGARVEVHQTNGALQFLRAAWRSRRSIISSSVVHLHTGRATLLVGLASATTLLQRSVATMHNPYLRTAPLMWIAKRVVCISEWDRDQVSRRSRGIVRPSVIYNGVVGSPRQVDLSLVQPEAIRPPSILYVGGLGHRKGVDLAIASMPAIRALVQEATLYVVGNRDNPTVERLAVDLHVDASVKFLGFRSDPRAVMMAADVLVVPSRAEGFGLVVIEARACGLPVVASSVGGIPEALDDGRAGLLITPGSAPAIASAVSRVLLDQDLRMTLRAAAEEGVTRYTVLRMVSEYDVVYAQLERNGAGASS